MPLPQGDSLISGKVSSGQGNQVQGIPVQGMIPASSDPRLPVVYGVTDNTRLQTAVQHYLDETIGGEVYAVKAQNSGAHVREISSG